MSRLLSTLIFCAFFASAFGQFGTIGLIGSATDGGWDEDTPMVQDPDDPNLWTLEITLMDGLAKFRADNDWAVNWGAEDFPIGTGVQGGDDIPVIAGDYTVSINTETGEYFFDYASDIGIIGSATPFGWDREVFMFVDPDNPDEYFVTLDLFAGEAKFRADGNWDLNWGGTEFPEGIAEENSSSNIPIPQAGKYNIFFNRVTAAYRFEAIIEYSSIGLLGSATAGGLAEETPLTRNNDDPEVWEGTVELTEGSLIFVADSGAVSWGGPSFPEGIAEEDGSDIVVTAGQAGRYLVSFNTSTLAYEFLLIATYETIGIVGDAVDSWEVDLPMEQDPNNELIWSVRAEFSTGLALFRADNSFDVNWGAGTFPQGTAVRDGAEIPVIAGEYRVTFNTTTGVYNFEEVFEYDAVSLVGQSGPFNAWPDPADMGAVDFFLNKGEEDPHDWTANSVTLRNFADDADGGIKFRADTAWTVNWGATDFPEGVGTPGGPNIEPVAGEYSVAFNSLSGEYAFGPVVSTREEILRPSAITLQPNPARSTVNIIMDTDRLGDNLLLRVYDLSGRELMSQRVDFEPTLSMDVSKLQAGSYFISISDGQYLISKQLVVVR